MRRQKMIRARGMDDTKEKVSSEPNRTDAHMNSPRMAAHTGR